MQNTRIKTVEILQSILEEKRFFSEMKSQIPPQNLPFVNMLILTTLRHYVPLKKILASFLKKKIPHKHRFAEYAVLLAMAEIFFMKTKRYAVVNETVKIISDKTDRFLGGLANSILRKISTPSEKYRKELSDISCIGDNFKEILHGYTPQEIKHIEESVYFEPHTDITVKQDNVYWADILQAIILPNGTLRLPYNTKINELKGYSDGDWWVQDVSAALPVLLLGDIKEKKVIDLCAAPGGKTAQLLNAGAKVTAIDIDAKRLNKLSENIARLNLGENLQTICDDALHFLDNSTEKFDIILLDAPCSASGTFRRHPEVLHIKSMQDVKQQKIIQRQLLDKCENILKKGGILLYSVCSICKEEGEYQINDFLKQHKNYQRLPADLTLISSFGKWSDNLLTSDKDIRTLPYFCKSEKGMDSFFICKMQRII